MNQCVSISFFRYNSLKNKIWGMSQMYRVRAPMKKMPGLQFFKPLGTGSGKGYSIIPDFSVYGLLAVWENEAAAESFLAGPLHDQIQAHSTEQYHIFMRPTSTRGSWSGFNEWQLTSDTYAYPHICAITRATIKKRFAFAFWRMVPRISHEQNMAEGLLFSKGIGEIPFFEQATFTVWKNTKSMEAFAYQNAHSRAIGVTRRKQGFREEMFTRLKPIKTFGSWNGENPIGTFDQG